MNESREITKKSEGMIERQQDLAIVAPIVDIYENDDEILLYADMPGVSKDKIVVNVDNGTLEISGIRNLEVTGATSWAEFGNVEYRRVFSVPQSIDVAAVNAKLKDGTLQLHLPKAEAAKPRTIEIKSA